MKQLEPKDYLAAKIAVGQVALGICAETEMDTFKRLEAFYWKAFKAGMEFSADSLIDDINKQFPEPLDP